MIVGHGKQKTPVLTQNFLFVVARSKMLVVYSTTGGFELPGFQQMVVDSRTGLRTMAMDISSGRLDLSNTKTLMLLVGRADVLNGEEMSRVLEQLQQALNDVKYSGDVVLVGPIPAAHD